MSGVPPSLERRRILTSALGAVLCACSARPREPGPSIEFTRIPVADPAGREKHDIIEGVVKSGRPGQQIVLYARSGKWWAQPLVSQPFTKINANTKWTNATHLGSEYAALLVDPSFRPEPTLDRIPEAGGGVAAVAVVPGAKQPPSRTIEFSGYEWRVRDAPSSRGTYNLYSSSNAWTDSDGAMHLRIARLEGSPSNDNKTETQWTCAEVSLTRNLGYGEYRFAVRDVSKFEPNVVFSMFTWDYAGGAQGNREMDIEVSHWGHESNQNAQFVVQPYYVASNISRFNAPSGRLQFSLHWEPGRVAFRALRPSGGAVAEHVFTSGVPSPGIESIRMNLYRLAGAVPLREGGEVVIEKFEYLP